MTAKRSSRKRKSSFRAVVRVQFSKVYGPWIIKAGELKRGRGRKDSVAALFELVGEKLPYDSLEDVAKDAAAQGIELSGVYVAHDSMGCARYVGRGDIITRLRKHKTAHVLELQYFSLYVVKESKHEREIETLLIRAAGPLLHFNNRKKRVDIAAGSILDYEAGTQYYVRQRKKGKKATKLKRP